MRILFLVWSSYPADQIYADPSVFYRCFHPAEALRKEGLLVSVLHREAISVDQLTEYDVVIFFRPQFSESFLKLFYAAEENSILSIASYDDLFFDINLLRQSNFRGLGAPQTQILNSRPYNYAQAMYFFDYFIASTDYLGERLGQGAEVKRIHIQYNAVSNEMFSLARLCTQRIERVSKRIGYFAGGASHSPDLEDISNQLAQVITEQEAEFFCVETVTVPKAIMDTGRVVTTPRMSYAGMVRAYSSCCVTIAPLHLNKFTSSKSGIKYLEASLVGAASVATPIPDIMRVSDERLVPVARLNDWKKGLLAGLALPTSAEITETQQEKIHDNFTTAIEARRLRKFLEEVSNAGPYSGKDMPGKKPSPLTPARRSSGRSTKAKKA